MKTIGIIGSRRRNEQKDFKAVEKAFLSIYQKGDTIVSGGCPKGGDRFAEIIAEKYQISIEIYKPNWKLGRHAGFLRNIDIAKNSNTLIACVAKDRTGGTEDTIRKFLKFTIKDNLLLVMEHKIKRRK